MKKNRHILAIVAAIAMLLTVYPMQTAQAADASAFLDIADHWAYSYILNAVEHHLFEGTSDTTFSPDDTMTRAMFVKVLASSSGENVSRYSVDQTKFKDIPAGAWYEKQAAWAYKKGIISGTSETTFSPDDPITRQQIAAMMIRYANYRQFILPRVRELKRFADLNACEDYAVDAVLTLYRSGIINGMGDNMFEPWAYATRAQAAVILCNYQDAEFRIFSDEEKLPLISHRGYNPQAPENTMPAFQKSVELGYSYIEVDVQFTKDGVPVLIHDTTIDRTSNGSGKVADYTLAQLNQYDFSYVNYMSFPNYRGTRICKYEDYIAYCAQKNINPVVELKSGFTRDRVSQLITIAQKYGMVQRISWISFNYDYLKWVKYYLDHANMVYLTAAVSDADIQKAQALQNGKNVVTIGADFSNWTDAAKVKCIRNELPFYVWTVDWEGDAIRLGNTSCEMLTTNNILWKNLYP